MTAHAAAAVHRRAPAAVSVPSGSSGHRAVLPARGVAGSAPAGGAGRRPANEHPGRRPTAGSLRDLAARFAVLFLEVEAGHRPRRQLAPLMTPLLYARVSEVWVRAGAPGTVTSVRGDAAGSDRYEAVAVVRRGQRFGALAFQLRRTASGWRVDDLIRPEDGRLPAPPYPVPIDEPDSFDVPATDAAVACTADVRRASAQPAGDLREVVGVGVVAEDVTAVGQQRQVRSEVAVQDETPGVDR